MTLSNTLTIIRSIIFLIVFYISTLFLLIIFIPTLFIPCKQAGILPKTWSIMSRKLLWIFCGIKIQLKGLENLPKENGYIIASKHQSAMETVLFHGIVPHVFYVLKRELLWIPFVGIYFLKTGCIAIDRKGGAKTMKQMLSGVKKHLADGMNLVIFPEGTRTAPGTKQPYTPGVAFLYDQCRVPVVPVALNTGYCWPKNKTIKRTGIVTIQFLPPIEAGKNKRAFLDELCETIETAQEKLPHPFNNRDNKC